MTTEWAVLEKPQGKTFVCRCKLFESVFEAIDFMTDSTNPNELELLDLETDDVKVLEYTPHVFIA